jgi:hypothetical protein
LPFEDRRWRVSLKPPSPGKRGQEGDALVFARE